MIEAEKTLLASVQAGYTSDRLVVGATPANVNALLDEIRHLRAALRDAEAALVRIEQERSND